MLETPIQLDRLQRDRLLRLVLETYATHPQRLRRALPELAQWLDSVLIRNERKNAESRYRLTDRERISRLEQLQVFRTKKKLSNEEAVATLANAAALLADGTASDLLERSWLVKLAKQVSGLSLDSKGKSSTKNLGLGDKGRLVSLIRGVTLSLTWDWRLLSIKIEPKELRRRRQALAFVGVAPDSRNDVAVRHDDYLMEVLSASG